MVGAPLQDRAPRSIIECRVKVPSQAAGLTEPLIARRTFTLEDQDAFAELCGDRNPIHIDPIEARRTMAGAPVVHGVHVALWVLNALFGRGLVSRPIASLKVTFLKFGFLDADVRCVVATRRSERLRADAYAGDVRLLTVEVVFDGQPPGLLWARDAAPEPIPTTPHELELADLARRSGAFQLRVANGVQALFPEVAASLGTTRVAAIAGLSTLVGMICPGLHSVFSDFEISCLAAEEIGTDLAFKVESFDERFRLIRMTVAGPGIYGYLRAFARHPPVKQKALNHIARSVDSEEFSGTNALIIGGSRGIGAMCAKLIVAGGGRAIVTYARGEKDAIAIAEELRPRCRILRYDVLEPAAGQLEPLESTVEHLYYCASLPIYKQKSSLFVDQVFQDFLRYYVSGFEDIYRFLQTRNPRLRALYPSSIWVEPRHAPKDFLEYSMAKAAGEALCTGLNRFAKATIFIERLPRIYTDQTATLLQTDVADAFDVMLPIVRAMHRDA
jgi:acyl dehydratase